MNFFASAYNLLFDQKTFFSQNAGKGLRLPAVLTVVCAVVSALLALPALLSASSVIPVGGDAVVAVGVFTVVFNVFLNWVVVSALFFASLKFIGYAECSYKQSLAVCGYVSAIILVQTVLLSLVGMIGSPLPVLTLLLQGVFLLWSVPVWYFGFAALCEVPAKKLRTVVAVPVIVMAAVSVISSAGTLLSF